MLVTYTPLSALNQEQLTRLRAMVNSLQLESLQHVSFDGMIISKAEILAQFPRNENKKPPGQQLNG